MWWGVCRMVCVLRRKKVVCGADFAADRERAPCMRIGCPCTGLTPRARVVA